MPLESCSEKAIIPALTRKPGDLPSAVVFRADRVFRADGGQPERRQSWPRFCAGLRSCAFAPPDAARSVAVPSMGYKVKSILTASFSWIALALPATAYAADAAKVDEGKDPHAILVTATRMTVPLSSITASITMVDKEALDRNQDISVSDVLLRTPSISMVRNGGYGTATNMRIRGSENDHIVVVVDGVKLNDPSSTAGGYNFAHMMVGDAAQIEILRGPQSILWGSQAIAGVVNIRTAMPSQPLEASFDIEAGSRETVSTRLGLGGQQGRLRWRIGTQYFTTAGISALAPAFGGKEKDGYRNHSVSGRAEWELSSDVRITAGGYYSAGRTDIDSTTADTPEYSKNREWLAHSGIHFALADGRLQNRLTLQYSNTSRINHNPARERTLTLDAEGSNKRAEYQGRFAINPAISLNFGADYERSEFRSRSPAASLATPLPAFAAGTAELTGFYGQILAEPIANVHLDAGVRRDEHSLFGGATLFAAGMRWDLPSGTTVRAHFSEGFKAPSLYQLYSEYGNDRLAPEQATGWEAGLEQSLFGGQAKIGATWFQRRIKNQIIYQPCPQTPPNPLCFVPSDPQRPRGGFYDNVSRSGSHGLEASANLTLGALSLAGNYGWAVSEDRGAANFGRWLPRRPRETANVSAHIRTPIGAEIGGAIRWAGKSYDNAANTLRLDSYHLVDLRAEMPLSNTVRFFARAENIFDKHYMIANRYATLGRSIYAGLRGRF